MRCFCRPGPKGLFGALSNSTVAYCNYIFGSQMTLVLFGKDLVFLGLTPQKTKDTWFPLVSSKQKCNPTLVDGSWRYIAFTRQSVERASNPCWDSRNIGGCGCDSKATGKVFRILVRQQAQVIIRIRCCLFAGNMSDTVLLPNDVHTQTDLRGAALPALPRDCWLLLAMWIVVDSGG